MKSPAPGAVRIVLLLLLIGCNSDSELSLPAPPAGYPTAYATAACGPADGPAVRLFLAAEPAEVLPPPAPFVEVAIWQGVTSLSNRRIEWTSGSSDGNARRCDAAGACEEAMSVAVQFRPIGADTTLTGTVTLVFAGGSTVAGGFNAAWRPSQLLCG
jgi:hypothetical protein